MNFIVFVQTQLYLLDLDKCKLQYFYCEHHFANIPKKKKISMTKFMRIYSKKYQQRSTAYALIIEYKTNTGESEQKRKKRNTIGGMVNLCKYCICGCGRVKKRKTNYIKQCKLVL